MDTLKFAAAFLAGGAVLGPWTIGCSEADTPQTTTSGQNSPEVGGEPDAGSPPEDAGSPPENDVCEARDEDECGSCTRATCCADLETYVDASGVEAFERCIEPCLDDACVEDCATASPAAGDAYDGLVSCQKASCAEPCVCGAASDDSRCLACTKVSCCSELVPLVLATDYDGFAVCMEPCTDGRCDSACMTSFPDAGGAYRDYADCALTECASDCG